MKSDKENAILECAKRLKEGEIILCPTDTIWGISCDASNEEAVQKIIKLKGRSEEKSFITLINSDRMVNQYFKELPEVAWDLFDLATEPLTLVLDGGQHLAPSVINKDGSLAVRMIKSGSCFELIRKLNKPMVSTSANFSGEPTPLTFFDIPEKIKLSVDYIFPFEQTSSPRTKASKIIRLGVNGELKILRK